MLLSCLTVLVTFFLGFIVFFKIKFRYWKNKGIPYENPTIPFGTMGKIVFQKETYIENSLHHYKIAKSSDYRHLGLFAFWTPLYVPIDIQTIKNIMIKDFNYFADRSIYYNEIDDPLSAHLFSINGDKWRKLRAKLNPSFSSGKLKTMFPTFMNCVEDLKREMDRLSASPEPINVGEVMKLFSTNTIGSCALGIECNSFENLNSDLMKYSGMALNLTLLQTIRITFGCSFPNIARRLGLKFFLPEVAEFFKNITKETIENRQKNNIKRNDFLQILMDLGNETQDSSNPNKTSEGLTLEEMAAQLIFFFVAGQDTSATVLMFCLYELSINEDIQEKTRDEIKRVLQDNGDQFTDESIFSMKYMKQVIAETLRKYPALPVLIRKCVADYPVPGTNFTIEKDTTVLIPVLGIHHDPEFYPDPEKFDPDRFSDENKSKIAPCTYLSFGEGPRHCLGGGFGKQQMRIALATLLKNYKFTLNSKTVIPLEVDPNCLVYTVKNGIWLNVSKI